ncbi:peptidoglycan-binding domain-containing protein [Profundibacter sp.]|uniref:peptidoglycan-binding domain-containing protein n=1 Tax=Profundibacter sp. TaxID=3101071 RepID=UPI003D123F5E
MIRITALMAASALFLTACQTATGVGTSAPTETITLHKAEPVNADPDTCWTGQTAPQNDGDIWFETPCPDALDTNFIAMLQRALKARGLYDGEIDGTLGTGTRKAIRMYQAAHGLDSDILALDAARQLGLIAYPRPDNT